MRLLFEMDKKDYEYCTHRFVRNSARSIIIRDGKIAMIHSLKYDYYKFPGGGIENGENPVEAMIRETREEAGLVVKPETVKEYGYVHRIQRSDMDSSECFVQDHYYYLCKAGSSSAEFGRLRGAGNLYIGICYALDGNSKEPQRGHEPI